MISKIQARLRLNRKKIVLRLSKHYFRNNHDQFQYPETVWHVGKLSCCRFRESRTSKLFDVSPVIYSRRSRNNKSHFCVDTRGKLFIFALCGGPSSALNNLHTYLFIEQFSGRAYSSSRACACTRGWQIIFHFIKCATCYKENASFQLY